MTKKNDTALSTRQPSEMQHYNETNPIGEMLNAIIARGVTAENATAMKELVGVYTQMEDRRAAQMFAAAKAALQAELPPVMATKTIPSKDGTTRSTFAPFEDIMAAVGPYLTKHGFSVSFDVNVPPGTPPRLEAVCKLTHVSGHGETNRFAVRIGSGPPGCSESQADGAARSYARRGALCDALNIVVDHDTDARSEGDYITPEQANDLRRRFKIVGGDESRLLQIAGAGSFEEIRMGRYGAVDAAIAKKERQRKAEEVAAAAVKAAKGPAPAPTEGVTFDMAGRLNTKDAAPRVSARNVAAVAANAPANAKPQKPAKVDPRSIEREPAPELPANDPNPLPPWSDADIDAMLGGT